MSIPSNIKRQLPKAAWFRVEFTPRPYFARFRLANAWRLQIAWFAVLVRAPWLEQPARQLHPHLF